MPRRRKSCGPMLAIFRPEDAEADEKEPATPSEERLKTART